MEVENTDIEKIYQEYAAKMSELKKEQDFVIKEFMAELEKFKIDKIRNNLNKRDV